MHLCMYKCVYVCTSRIWHTSVKGAPTVNVRRDVYTFTSASVILEDRVWRVINGCKPLSPLCLINIIAVYHSRRLEVVDQIITDARLWCWLLHCVFVMNKNQLWISLENSHYFCIWSMLGNSFQEINII